MTPRRNAIRVEFSTEHDCYLYKYLARHCPSKEGRSGNKIFMRLVANEKGNWPWSVHHSWQSWRERYVKHSDKFDALILNYQRKHGIKSTENQKRDADPTPTDLPRPSAKRAKLEAETAPSSETRTKKDMTPKHARSSPSKSKMISKGPREHQEALPQAHPPREPEPMDVQPPSLPRPNNDTNTDAANKPSLDLPVLQTRHDTLEIPSSPKQPAASRTDGEPKPRSSQRAMKRIEKRHRTPSEVFASEPSSPRRDSTVVDVGGASIPDTIHPRAPPYVADSFRGRALADQKGHVPRALPHGEENGAEEEVVEEVEAEVEAVEVEEDVQWPPPRGHTAKQRTVSGAGVEAEPRHPFSQSQPQTRPEGSQEGMTAAERERRKPDVPFGHVSRPSDGTQPDRRTETARLNGVAPQAESKQHEDIIWDGTSPVKRIVPTTPAPAPPCGLTPDSVPKAFKFPPPRASTRSPFRPEPPAGKIRHLPPRPQSRTKAARHPALRHIRRQTIDGNTDGNGHEREDRRGREHGQVPSIDLVAQSRSSTSVRSHSRSSASTSIAARPSRWSLPSFAHATPWVINDPEGAPSVPGSTFGSGSSSSSPFRWVAPSPVYADILERMRASALGGTSTPRLTSTSPVRPNAAIVADTNISAPPPNPIAMSSSLSVSPHPFDVPLAVSHGLASILAHMSANHGLALSVVEAVYTRVGSLREADAVLMGMRKAAEGFGEREIEKMTRGRREKRRGSGMRHEGKNGAGRRGREGGRQGSGEGKGQKRTVISYVAASEDGEGSEYSPPETSRAALWKQQSETASYVEEREEGGDEEKNRDDDDDDEEEGRVVEEELLEVEGESERDSEDGPADRLHDFSHELMEGEKAQELERWMGRKMFLQNIVKLF